MLSVKILVPIFKSKFYTSYMSMMYAIPKSKYSTHIDKLYGVIIAMVFDITFMLFY